MVWCQITALSRGIASPFLCFPSFFSDFVSSFCSCSLSCLGSPCCCGSSCFGSSCARREVALPKSRIAKQINEKGYRSRIVRLSTLKRPNNLGDRFFGSVLHWGWLGAL